MVHFVRSYITRGIMISVLAIVLHKKGYRQVFFAIYFGTQSHCRPSAKIGQNAYVFSSGNNSMVVTLRSDQVIIGYDLTTMVVRVE